MRLYDTLSQQKVPLDFPDGTVRLYVCGVTPYDTSHIGHARVAVVYDTLRRYLEWSGLRVRYVQNVTDIDEPLFERAKRDGEDWRALGERQTAYYLASIARLNVPRPEFYVKATSEIPQMLPRIARLVALGHAYVRDGWVYYRVASKPDFGAIFHQDYATMLATANENGNIPDDPRKEDPLDFVLWRRSEPDEPEWPSPWGRGRPGWHIECSTIAAEVNGPQLDIHGGGADLIFPHHACEIAQAEPVTGVVPFVRAWMHTGLVSLDGVKMSKSLGNMVFVDDVLRTHSGDALRLAILACPYRAPLDYRAADVAAAEARVTAIGEALAAPGGAGSALDAGPAVDRFRAALADDFDTPAAVDAVTGLAGEITRAASAGQDVAAAQAVLRELGGMLGLRLTLPPDTNGRD